MLYTVPPEPEKPAVSTNRAGSSGAGPAYARAADLLDAGKSPEEAYDTLIGEGVEAALAESVIDDLLAPRRRRRPRTRRMGQHQADVELLSAAMHGSADDWKEIGKRNMFFGAMWCIGGLAVTVITLAAASQGQGGGTYVIAWGAILCGGVQFLRGLSQAAGGAPR